MIKKIHFLAQFPPPMHGLTKAVQTLYRSSIGVDFELSAIDISDNKNILQTIWRIVRAKTDIFYFTISQTVGGNWRDLLLFKVIKWKEAKVIIHLHGGYYRTLIDEHCGSLQRKLNYSAMKEIDGAIVLGDSLKWIFSGLVPEEKIYVVKNCVDDEFTLTKSEIEEKVRGVKEGGIIEVMYLSNFIEAKGYREVLELARIAKEECNTNIHFNFAGKFLPLYAQEEEYFNNYIEKYQLQNYVTYHGVVGGEKKRELLKLCHVFVLLTRYPNEGQPISILEAYGNGQVVVTTNHAGIPDIADSSTGLVIDKNSIDLNKVYQFICSLDKDREKMVQIGCDNYQKSRDLYTEEQYVESMRKVFKEF
ncbi:MAG: glycosyltransferase family 4 protein [Bacteroidales bacterium]|nr:glycosyltransferase family 4 protein [Bacteroidales bacterium]